MARYRARRDYRYLEGHSAYSAFDQAYRDRNYGAGLPLWPVHVNLRLIRMFEGREGLDRGEAIALVLADRVAEGRRTKGSFAGAFEGDVAGNNLGWGVHLGLLTVTEEAGRRTWAMPDREPWFVVDGKRARQVRGLTEAAAADQARRAESRAKREATLRAKAAAENRPRIEAGLSTILLHDPGFVIPAQAWPFPDDQWDIYVRNLALPVPLVEVLPIVQEAHETMEPKRQTRWLHVIERAAWRAKAEAEERRRDVERAAWAAAKAAAQAADDAALEGL